METERNFNGNPVAIREAKTIIPFEVTGDIFIIKTVMKSKSSSLVAPTENAQKDMMEIISSEIVAYGEQTYFYEIGDNIQCMEQPRLLDFDWNDRSMRNHINREKKQTLVSNTKKDLIIVEYSMHPQYTIVGRNIKPVEESDNKVN